MTGSLLLYCGVCIIWGPLLYNIVAGFVHRRKIDTFPFGLAGGAVALAGNLLIPDWPWAIAWAVTLVVLIAIWWHRRRRRRTLVALGAKGKARIAAMVGTMRERAQPRPVLRPQRSPA